MPIGLTKMISLTKSSFNHPSVMESPLRLPPPLNKAQQSKGDFCLNLYQQLFRTETSKIRPPLKKS
jgi:hypothetical protein